MTRLAQDKTKHAPMMAAAQVTPFDDAPPWLDALRAEGLKRFNELGIPLPKDEEYRYTSFAPLNKINFVPASRGIDESAEAHVHQGSFGKEAAAELVFVNGFYAPDRSRLGQLPPGITVRSFSEALRIDDSILQKHLAKYCDLQNNPFVALNTGAMSDGILIHLARGTRVVEPIHLLFVSTASATPTVSHPRMLLVAEDDCEISLAKSFIGAPAIHWTNSVTEIVAGENCKISHNRFDRGSDEGFRTTYLQAVIGRDSQFISHIATIGGRLTRNDLNCVLAGKGADATLNGLAILRGYQHCDNHTLLDHAAPNCTSHELYKHVLDGNSTCVFKGKILVQQIAQKTNSKQASKALLLSDDARMDSQPALEIYADDVKCTHGSTTGPVDEEMVFYLRSRGVGMEAARHLLTYAFAADVSRRIKIDPVRRRLEDFMAAQHGLPRDLRITDLAEHDAEVKNM